MTLDRPARVLNVDDNPAGLYAKTRILRFLNAFSHLDQIADPEHNPSMLAETPSVLRDLFALIEKSDPTHFKNMNDLVASV